MFKMACAAIAALTATLGQVAALPPAAAQLQTLTTAQSTTAQSTDRRSPASEDEIRGRRVAYNAALQARDEAAIQDFLMPEMVELLDSASLQAGRDAVVRSYVEQEFKNPAFIAYDRITDTVEISSDGRSAVERGHWRGRYRQPDGTIDGNRGLYQAGWKKHDGEWRIRTESYVQLQCARRPTCG